MRKSQFHEELMNCTGKRSSRVAAKSPKAIGRGRARQVGAEPKFRLLGQ
jgi:hypothetical protein